MTDTGIQRIYRHESTQYTTVPNWVVRDPKYTPNAFRLLAYLLSHQDGYELTYGQIERQTTLGRYAINQSAQFLIGEGWLEWERVKGSDGRWLAKKWIIKDPQATVPLSNHSTMEPFHYGTTNGLKEEQLLEKNTKREKHSLRETPLPEDWEPSPELMAMFATKWPDIDPKYNTEQFKLYYLAKGTKHKNWDLTFQRWQNTEQARAKTQPWRAGAGNSEAAQLKRDSEREKTQAFLEEMRQLDAQSAPPPTCRHGSSIARCVKCIKTIS